MSEVSERPGSLLERLEEAAKKINQLDFLVIAARKSRLPAPPHAEIFEALAEAAIVCADVIEAAQVEPIPPVLRDASLSVQISISDLAVTLRLYAKLAL